ncbi:MAG: hypothetical protein OEV78_07010, partial [Spirochaetia bacterium]|nr:hypothetical protein [Spirochaetia bacterium]
MKKIKPFSMVLTILFLNFFCSDSVVEKIQKFKPNVPPEIIVFTSDSPGGATLLPNQTFHVHVEASDPNGNKITYKYDSALGAFSGQFDKDKMSDVVYTLPGVLNAGFTAIVRVTVTDEKGASTSQDLNLGSGKLGPQITLNSTGTSPFLVSSTNAGALSNGGTQCSSFSWTADADGFFQVRFLTDPALSCSMDTSINGNFKFYSKGTPVNVTVHGPGATCPALPNSVDINLTNGTVNNDQVYKVCVGVRDALAQDSFVGGTSGYPFTLDNTPPSSTTPTINNASIINGQVFTSQQSIVFNCVDALSPCNDLMYTSSYSPTPTPAAATAPVFTTSGTNALYTANASQGIVFGNNGDGSYEVRVISRDNAGNIEPVTIFNFAVNSALPVISAAAPTKAAITTTGDTVNFGTSDIVWSANEGGNFAVVINPVSTTAPCGVNDTTSYANFAAITNSTGLGNSGPYIPGIGATVTSTIKAAELAAGINNVYVCVHDGFSYSWISKQIFKDDTAPLFTMTPLLGGATYTMSQGTVFSCTDSSACRISYTQDYLANTKTAPAGIAPNFAGSGTVVNGPASANILFGNLGDGTYTVKYVSQDAVGNPPALTVKTETFSVNNVTPVINLAGTPTNAIVTTTGDTVTYGTSNITWNSTDNGTYIVMINAACPAAWPGDTAALVQAYAGAGKSTGTNNSGSLTANAKITTTILATDLTLEGANIIRLCTNDGFSTVEKAVTINRDNTKPVTAMSPNLNNLSFAGSQSVTFNCSDANGCYGIAYTEAMLPISGGAFPAVTVPSFTATTTPATNIALGNTSGPVTLGATNAQKYTTAFISKDVVGNTEIFAALVNQAQYNIDSTLPQVTKVSGPTNAFITTTLNGVQTSSVTWSANKSGTYYVNINRACTASTNSTGAGNTAAYTLGTSGNITSTFVATDAAFTPGNNTINICLWDPVLSTWGVLPINVNVDNTAPVVAYTPNINGIFTTPQSITFSCTDVSGAGCVSMRYTTGFTANSSTAPAVTAPVYTSPTADAGTGTLITGTSGLASVGGSGDGTYKVMYIGRDSVGNVAAAGSLVFYVNQTSPSITYVSGPSNAAVTTTGNTASFGSSDIVWKANEAGQTYLIYINTACPATWPGGTAVPASPTTTNITTTVNASSLLAGANTVNICLNDGFVTTSMAKSIYRDDTAPVSAGTVPAATYTTAQNVTFSCTDNVSCSAISYTVAYNAHSAVAPAAITPNFAGTGTVINGASGNVVLGNQGDGTYTVSRISKDSVGNVEAPVSFSFSVDGTQPLITPSPTFTPTQATVTTTGSTIAFFGTTYQSTAITWSTNQPSSYYVKVNALCSTTTLGTSNAAGTNVSGTIAASTNVTTTINASAAVPWLAGANTIRICAFDGFTTASSSATVNLDNTAPAIAPAITLTSLGSTSATFNITGGTTDTVYYDYSTNGTTWSTPGIYAATPSFTASGLTAGTAYTLSVRFYDAVGNIGPTTTMNFTPGYTVTVTATNIPAVTAGNELKFTLSTSGQVLTFPAAGGSGTLTFTARLANAVSFNVATTQPGITPASICSFTDNAWGTIASANKILNVNCVSGYQYARTIAPSNPTGNRPMTTDSLYTSNLVTGQGTVFGLAKVGNVLYFTVQGTHQVKSVNLTTKAVALVAGSGVAGHVDGTGTAAYFNDPRSITTDGSNLYVAEYSGNCIRKINITTGAVTTLAGTGLNSSTDNANSLLGTVGGPVGIDMWGNNLVFEEYNYHKVRKINLTTGQLSTIAGTGTAGYADNATGTLAKFNLPHGITVDSINNAAYVADASNHRIRKVDLTTNAVTTVAGSDV